MYVFHLLNEFYLYFYTNMLPALGPLLHLEIISATMGVANCIPRNERGLDLP
jgi:hypothetical protein